MNLSLGTFYRLEIPRLHSNIFVSVKLFNTDILLVRNII